MTASELGTRCAEGLGRLLVTDAILPGLIVSVSESADDSSLIKRLRGHTQL